MALPVLKHKYFKLDQRKIAFAQKYFGVRSEQEAIDRALALLMEEEQIAKRLSVIGSAQKGQKAVAIPVGAKIVLDTNVYIDFLRTGPYGSISLGYRPNGMAAWK
jgi:hypothetical protein